MSWRFGAVAGGNKRGGGPSASCGFGGRISGSHTAKQGQARLAEPLLAQPWRVGTSAQPPLEALEALGLGVEPA